MVQLAMSVCPGPRLPPHVDGLEDFGALLGLELEEGLAPAFHERAHGLACSEELRLAVAALASDVSQPGALLEVHVAQAAMLGTRY